MDLPRRRTVPATHRRVISWSTSSAARRGHANSPRSTHRSWCSAKARQRHLGLRRQHARRPPRRRAPDRTRPPSYRVGGRAHPGSRCRLKSRPSAPAVSSGRRSRGGRFDLPDDHVQDGDFTIDGWSSGDASAVRAPDATDGRLLHERRDGVRRTPGAPRDSSSQGVRTSRCRLRRSSRPEAIGLTTVRQPVRDIGRLGARLDARRARRCTRQVRLPREDLTLVERISSSGHLRRPQVTWPPARRFGTGIDATPPLIRSASAYIRARGRRSTISEGETTMASRRRLAALAIVAGVAFAACGSDEDEAPPPRQPPARGTRGTEAPQATPRHPPSRPRPATSRTTAPPSAILSSIRDVEAERLEDGVGQLRDRDRHRHRPRGLRDVRRRPQAPRRRRRRPRPRLRPAAGSAGHPCP